MIGMDLMAPLNYVYHHPQAVSGVVIVLICATAILLLVRALGQKNEESAAGATKVEATIDVDTIEGAMKRVLASQGPVAASPAPVVIAGDDEAVNAALREREARIAELQTEIANLRADLEGLKSRPAELGGGAAPGDDARVAELEQKIEELKGRLQEYEIIEDDIADLSLYKDENARLKHEIKRLREEFPEAAGKVPTAEEEAAKADVDAATDAIAAAETPVGAEPAPTPAGPEPAAEDDVMKQFAAAVQVQKAPPPEADLKVESNPFGADADPTASAAPPAGGDDPLAFDLDPDKIMTEVSTLSASDEASSALEDSLDTDKLLAEVGSLNGEAPAPAPAAAPKPEAQPAPQAEIKAFDPLAPDMPAVDDLLAEFKETKS